MPHPLRSIRPGPTPASPKAGFGRLMLAGDVGNQKIDGTLRVEEHLVDLRIIKHSGANADYRALERVCLGAVEAIANMSQMTVTGMSITETTDSPQHKQHWLAEQALAWSGLPVVTLRPTGFIETFFVQIAANGVRENDELILPLGNAKTSPIAAVDVARVVTKILNNPAPHIGQIYNLTDPESADINRYAGYFSEALGRTIRYRSVPVSAVSEKLRQLGIPEHVVKHIAVLAELHGQGRFDRMTDDVFKLTGQKPMSMREFVKEHAALFSKS